MKSEKKTQQKSDSEEARIDALLDRLADTLLDKWLTEKRKAKAAHMGSAAIPISSDNVSV